MLRALLDGDAAECLEQTCRYLRNGDTEKLEQEWIAMSALNGMHTQFHSGNTWHLVNKEILSMLETDKIRVKEALALTSKLCLLYKRAPYTSQLTPMKSLRTKILPFIPESAKLAYTGINTFSRLLPQPDASEFAFYSRVLASFGKLASDENPEALRLCTEYISRKKLPLKLPETYPAPSEKDNGDPDWFLWGFYLLYYAGTSNQEIVATNWKLHSWNWSKGMKTARQGLLWGVAFCIPKSSYQTDFIWSNEEKKVLEQVDNMALELWNASEHKPEPMPAMDFMPRTWTSEIIEPTSPHDFLDTKHITIKQAPNDLKNHGDKPNSKKTSAI